MRILSSVAALVGLLAVASPANASPPYKAFYVFGDSLSDAGNVYTALGGAEPVSPPYSHGRFSNGPVWAQDLAVAIVGHTLSPSLLGGSDFAFGGAESGQTSVHTLAPNDLPSQLAQFLAEVPQPRARALYGLWIGANDLFSILSTPGLSSAQVSEAENQIVGNEAAFVTAITMRGAHNLLVVNVPDLGRVPSVTAQGAAASAAATALTSDFNARLVASLQAQSSLSGLHLTVVDAMALIDAAVADPAAYGLTDTTTRCWTGSYTSASSGSLCSSMHSAQDTHLFWDGMHPTARGHAALATLAAQGLGQN